MSTDDKYHFKLTVFIASLMNLQRHNSSAIDAKLKSTAPLIAEAIFKSAIASTQTIENAVCGEANWPHKFSDEDFQDIVTEFASLFLHVCTREVFERIADVEQRGVVLDAVFSYVLQLGTTLPMGSEHPIPAFTRKIERGILVQGYGLQKLNERQAEYADLTLFAGEGKPLLAGTLFWEFGRHVAIICARYTPDAFNQMEAKIIATEAYKSLIPLFGSVIAPPKPAGILRRLFE